MNLEQRVQMLEQEVQLLKAQIQNTLLDIQEQMLNRTYPMLSSAIEIPPAASSAAPAEHTAPASAAKKISLADLEAAQDSEFELPPAQPVQVQARAQAQPQHPPQHQYHQPQPEPPPSARSVVLREEPVQAAMQAAVQAEPFELEPWKYVPQQAAETNSLDWFELDNWVSQKVEKLGIRRTRDLINLYAEQAQFSLQERELLMQFINIYDSEKTDKPQTEVYPVLYPIQGNAPAKIAPRARAVVEDIQAKQRNQRDKAAPGSNGAAPFTERQELVLRLIAGILSADDTSGHAQEPAPRKRASR
jgi:hypothetical protein